MPVHNVYKPLGWSSLQVIEAFKDRYPAYADVPMTFSGRLDPMAEGVMVLLSGNERLSNQEFQKLDKTYDATWIFGLSSDTYDCLGMITEHEEDVPVDPLRIDELLLGTHTLPFPPYSSYKVEGKPLHHWARSGKIDEVEIPTKDMQVSAVSNVLLASIDREQLLDEVIRRIRRVRGAFRQASILEQWKSVGQNHSSFIQGSATLTVNSGTYIRALVHWLGKELGSGAVLFSLKRTRVGLYELQESLEVTTQGKL